MRYLFNWERETRGGWRRTFIWWQFKTKRPSIPKNCHLNPKMDLDHKTFWAGYGPDFQWWFQIQDFGQWACGVTWLSFSWLNIIGD